MDQNTETPHESKAINHFIPDIILYHTTNKTTSLGTIDELPGSITSSSFGQDVKNLKLSIEEVLIKRNREIGRAEIYLLATAIDDLSESPIKTEIRTFEGVRDNQKLTIASLGIYRNDIGKQPRYIHYRIHIVESDEDIRRAGEFLEKVRNSEKFKSLLDAIIKMSGASEPSTKTIRDAADFVIEQFAELMRANRDDQLIYVVGDIDSFDSFSQSKETDFAKIVYQLNANS